MVLVMPVVVLVLPGVALVDGMVWGVPVTPWLRSVAGVSVLAANPVADTPANKTDAMASARKVFCIRGSFQRAEVTWPEGDAMPEVTING
jgi:hypothetical protein